MRKVEEEVRKSVGLLAVLMLACVVLWSFPVNAGIPYCWFNKSISEDGLTWLTQPKETDPPVEVYATVGQNEIWQMKITVTPDEDIFDAVVTDRFGAEIEIDLPFPVIITHGTASWDHGPGHGKKSKSGKVFLTWEIGDLTAGTTATLQFTISTGLNGAGKQQYTSCGRYELNSGAVLKFFDTNEKQVSVYTLPIYVIVSG